MRGLVVGDRALLIEEKAKLVDPVEQAMPGERIEREPVRASVGERHRLSRQIDRHLLTRRFGEHVEQNRVCTFGQQREADPS